MFHLGQLEEMDTQKESLIATYITLTECTDSEYAALDFVRNSPMVLRISSSSIIETYSAWATRLQSVKETRILITKQPMLLELSPINVVSKDSLELWVVQLIARVTDAMRITSGVLRALSRRLA